jgi:putative sterol carrier protein
VAQQAAEAAFGSFVRGRSDSQLEKTVGSGPGLRMLFKGMTGAFDASKAAGFTGEIAYELAGSSGVQHWTVTVDEDRAVAEPRAAADAAVTMRVPLPVFIRIAAREVNPAKAMLEGDLVIEGDFVVAGRLAEMFGGEPQW